MKLRYLWPKGFSDQVISLSRFGLTRLSWMDWYLSHGKNARATCRHFGISPDTFYLWKNRFNHGSLITLEDNKKTRRPKHIREMTTPQRKVSDIQRKVQQLPVPPVFGLQYTQRIFRTEASVRHLGVQYKNLTLNISLCYPSFVSAGRQSLSV